MANILANPNNFTDGTNSPPSQWDGSKYVFVNNGGVIALNQGITTASGDTMSFDATSVLGDSSLRIFYLDTDTQAGKTLLDKVLSAGSEHFDLDLPVSSFYEIAIVFDGGGCSGDTVTLIPGAAPVVIYGPFIRQQTTHRAYRNYDSPQTCYLRYESGRPDLSAATIKVYIRNLDHDFRALRKLDGTGDASGMVTFTIPKGTFRAGTVGADYQLGVGDRRANNFRFEILVNGVLGYEAILEVV